MRHAAGIVLVLVAACKGQGTGQPSAASGSAAPPAAAPAGCDLAGEDRLRFRPNGTGACVGVGDRAHEERRTLSRSTSSAPR